jgi:hypothetical protein
LVRAENVGTATITAAWGGARATAVVEVFETIALNRGQGGDCAVRSDGRTFCWAGAGVGGIGRSRILPTEIPSNAPLVDVQVGWDHACGLSRDQRVYCWGTGPIGRPGRVDTFTLVEFPELVRAVRVGYFRTCALTVTGRVHCLGDGSVDRFGGDLVFAEMAVSQGDVYGVTAAGQLYLLGESTADPLLSELRFTRLDTEAGVCGVTPGGQAYCRGFPIKDGEPRDGLIEIVGVPALAAAAGRSSNPFGQSGCGLTPDGVAYCWGANHTGQIGNGTVSDAMFPPIPVATSLRFVSIHPADLHTCGLATNGRAYCWGANDSNELGNPLLPHPTPTPSPVLVP